MTRTIGAVAICLLVACDNSENIPEATRAKREALEKAPAERQAEAIEQSAVEAERYAAEAAQIEAAIAGCEYIKTIQKHGSSRVAVYINSDFPREHAYFLAAAEKHFRDSNYVYFFTDRGKASAWNPTDFGPGPQHDSLIGRAYRDGDYREYTPRSEWISLSP